MRLPITLLLKLYTCLLSFPRYNDVLVENIRFFAILPTPVSFEALARKVPWDTGYEC